MELIGGSLGISQRLQSLVFFRREAKTRSGRKRRQIVEAHFFGDASHLGETGQSTLGILVVIFASGGHGHPPKENSRMRSRRSLTVSIAKMVRSLAPTMAT